MSKTAEACAKLRVWGIPGARDYVTNSDSGIIVFGVDEETDGQLRIAGAYNMECRAKHFRQTPPDSGSNRNRE